MSVVLFHCGKICESTGIVVPFDATTPPEDAQFLATYVSHGEYQGTTWTNYKLQSESYVGKVVETFYQCDRVMSDVWENVQYAWVALDDGEFKKICIGYQGKAIVDASEEMKTQFAFWQARKEAERRAKAEADAIRAAEEREIAEAKEPKKGRTLKVVKGRKVKIGTVGECFWVGETRWGWRVGMNVTGEKDPVWTDIRNVEAVA